MIFIWCSNKISCIPHPPTLFRLFVKIGNTLFRKLIKFEGNGKNVLNHCFALFCVTHFSLKVEGTNKKVGWGTRVGINKYLKLIQRKLLPLCGVKEMSIKTEKHCKKFEKSVFCLDYKKLLTWNILFFGFIKFGIFKSLKVPKRSLNLTWFHFQYFALE